MGAHDSGAGAWRAALGVALLMQTASAFLTRVFPIMGPVLTEAAGVPSESVGILASVGSAGTMWFLVAGGGLLAQLGAVRILQIGALVGASGVLIALSGGWWALMLASLLIGLGYGPSPPAGSDILKRFAPARHRSLVFSIKQSGVPLGGAIAAVLVPAVVLAAGWRVACLAAVALTLTAVLASERFRRNIDRHAPTGPGWRLGGFLDPRAIATPFRSIRRSPALFAPTYASVGFAVAQGSVFAFLVTYLAVELGLGLARAGLAFASLQVAGVFGRVLVGWLADRVGSARRMLVALACASAAATACLSAVDPSWPQWAVLGLSAAGGVAIASWNGVFLAEVSTLVEDALVGEATAAVTFFTFFGYVVGPSLFGLMLALGGSYEAALLLTAGAPLSGAIVLAVGGPAPKLEAA